MEQITQTFVGKWEPIVKIHSLNYLKLQLGFTVVELITTAELRSSEIFYLKENQKYFDEKKLKILSRDFKLIYGKNEFIRCEGRLKFAPLPYEVKTPHSNSTKHYLADLIVRRLHERSNHILIK